MGRSNPAWPALLAVLVVSAGGCATARLKPACLDRSVQDADRQDPKAERWLTIFLRGPSYDCRGEPIAWSEEEELARCEVGEEPAQLLPPAEIGTDQVVVEYPSKKERLVWVITRRYDNGEGLGPVGLVELESDHVRVDALGNLRAMTSGAQLEVLPLGEDGHVLVAEGQHCVGEHCRRTARLLVRRGSSWVPVTLQDNSGKCVGPARFDLARIRIDAIDRGWKKETVLTASRELKDGVLLVHERVTVYEFDPKNRDATRREVSHSEGTRHIRWSHGYLVSDDRPLWSRIFK